MAHLICTYMIYNYPHANLLYLHLLVIVVQSLIFVVYSPFVMKLIQSVVVFLLL